MTNVWILSVEIAYPDWKRPYVETHIETFSSKQRALERLRHYQIGYILSWNLDTDIFANDDEMEKWQNELYSDSYMHQPPFKSNIWEAIYQDDLVDISENTMKEICVERKYIEQK